MDFEKFLDDVVSIAEEERIAADQVREIKMNSKGREGSKMTDNSADAEHNVIKMMRFWYEEFHAR